MNINDKSDVVILKGNIRDDISKMIIDRGYRVYEFYKGFDSFVLRQIRKIWFKFNLPLKSIWYSKDILRCDCDKILVFESLLTPEYLSWLKSKKQNASINVWYWNIVKNTIDPKAIADTGCRLWSFSREDCKKYNMSFNPPPYFKEVKYPEVDTRTDICFVGKEKGRLQGLLHWKSIFESQGLCTEFYITPNNKLDKNPNYSHPMSYIESMLVSASSKAVFDYIEVINSGQSMRIMECIFNNRKIITNSVLIKDYDFYDSNNIFIVGEDDIGSLYKFVNSPYKKISEEILLKYDFEHFVERFWCRDDSAWWRETYE